MGVDAMVEAVELIKKGRAPRIPQDDSKATYEPPCDDRVAALDFERTVKEVYNFIRGCDPQPGAYTIFRGKRVRLYDAAMESSPVERKAGEVISFDKESIQVAARGGIIRIGKLRVDKEKIGPMEFAKQVDLKEGDRFGD
jgi:methionyl-tRNA formyltransferase